MEGGWWCAKAGSGRGDMEIGGGDNGGAGGFLQGCARGGQKMRKLLGIKQVQRRDVQAQRRDVPEGGAAIVATLRFNVAM